MSVVERTRVSQVTPEITRHSPRNGLRLIACSPRRPGFFATVISRVFSQDLMPASGHQDHTSLPSASAPFVKSASASTASPPHVRDDRETPLCVGAGCKSYSLIRISEKQKYFFGRGWTSHHLEANRGEVICPSGNPHSHRLVIARSTRSGRTVSGAAVQPQIKTGPQGPVEVSNVPRFLLDLGLAEFDVLARDRVVLLLDQLVGHGARILLGDVIEAGIRRGDELDLDGDRFGHVLKPLMSGIGRRPIRGRICRAT